MSQPPGGSRTVLRTHPISRDQLVGYGNPQSFPGIFLIDKPNPWEDQAVTSLRNALREVVGHLDLKEGQWRLAIDEIHIYERMERNLRNPRGVRRSDGAVDFDRDHPILFLSESGLLDPWVCFQFIAKSLDQFTLSGPNGQVHRTMKILKKSRFPGDPQAGWNWHRIRCDSFIFRGFFRSPGFKGLGPPEKSRHVQTAKSLENSCRRNNGDEMPVTCDC